MKLNQKTSSILFVLLIIVVFTFVIFTVYYMVSNKEAFTENPFIFGAKKMHLGNCHCNCFDGVNPQPKSFYFNQTSFGQGIEGR